MTTQHGSAVKLKHPGIPSMEQTAAYINAWSISGFSHSSLWDRYIMKSSCPACVFVKDSQQ